MKLKEDGKVGERIEGDEARVRLPNKLGTYCSLLTDGQASIDEYGK